MYRNIVCLTVGLLAYGLLGVSAKYGKSVDSSSELNIISSSVSLLARRQVVPPRPCVSRVGSPERPSSKGSSYCGTFCDRSPGAWTPGKCNRPPDVWAGFLLAWDIGVKIMCDRSSGAWAPGTCNRSPDAFEGSSGLRGS